MTPLVHDDREYLRAFGDELHTDLGTLTVPKDVEADQTLEIRTGGEFFVRGPRGPDLFSYFERIGAPMMPRSIGLIVGRTGVAAGERVPDAGTGTDTLSAYLGCPDVDVTTFGYDVELANAACENMYPAGVEQRVDVRTGDITDELDDLAGSEFGVLTLDTESAPEVIHHIPGLFVTGGYVVVYSPFVEDTRVAVEAVREAGLSDVKTFETIQQQVDFSGRGSRPSTTGVGHTGYLVLARNE